MSLLTLTLALLNMVCIFFCGKRYQKDGSFIDILLGVLCFILPAHIIISAYMGG